jgi:outer membrane protein assembly factor BamB
MSNFLLHTPHLYSATDELWGLGEIFVIDRGELFIGGNVLDAQTGETIHYEERFDSSLPPTVTETMMYLPALDDGVVAFDRTNYEAKWIYPSPIPTSGSGPVYTLSRIALLNEIGYVIFSDATLRAFDLETGQEVGHWQPSAEDLIDWRVCIYPNPRSECIEAARAGLTASEDTRFVSFGDGTLYAFGEE